MAAEKDVSSSYFMLFYMLGARVCVCQWWKQFVVLTVRSYIFQDITRLLLINKDWENITLSHIRYSFNADEISYLTVLHRFFFYTGFHEGNDLYLLSKMSQEKLWGPPSLLFSGYQDSLLEAKELVCEVNH